MNKKWLVIIGVFNLFAIAFAFGGFMVSFAILAPDQLQYEIGNPESVKRAIFQAQSLGIEMMRDSALGSGVILAFTLFLNFIALCYFGKIKNRQ